MFWREKMGFVDHENDLPVLFCVLGGQEIGHLCDGLGLVEPRRGPEGGGDRDVQAAAAAGRIGHVNDGVARPVEAVHRRSDCYCLACADVSR